MPLRDVTMCMVADIWSFNISNLSQNPADAEPEYKGRARFKPSIKGGQPVVQGPLTTTNKYLSNPTNKKVYCVTIPYVKPKGRQFVDLLYYTEPCLYGTTFRGWVELPNPYNSSILCRSNITTSSSKASTTKYSIRSIVVRGLSVCPCCYPALHSVSGWKAPASADSHAFSHISSMYIHTTPDKTEHQQEDVPVVPQLPVVKRAAGLWVKEPRAGR